MPEMSDPGLRTVKWKGSGGLRRHSRHEAQNRFLRCLFARKLACDRAFPHDEDAGGKIDHFRQLGGNEHDREALLRQLVDQPILRCARQHSIEVKPAEGRPALLDLPQRHGF